MHTTGRLIAAGAVVVAVVIGMASTIFAQDIGPLITGAVTFTVVAPDTERKTIDVGDHGPSLGDLLVFSGPLLRREPGTPSTTVGRIDGYCTTTSAPGPSAEVRQLCVITTTFNERSGVPGSEIDLQGVGRVEAEDVVLGVTGGTGRYQNARGQATLDFRRSGRVVITYELIP